MLEIAGKRVTVAGLGHFGGGIAVSKWLVEQGARVLVTDREPAQKMGDAVAQLRGLPIEYRLGGHREEDFSGADVVVASPAIPPDNAYLAAARKAGVPVTTEICLFVERCRSRLTVGVTGTKGKSTTTAMLGQMLMTRHPTCVGGNIGRSLLLYLSDIGPSDVVVLELSSYMLHYLGERRWSPHVGLITMIADDHIKWHGSREAYAAAKVNLVRFQTADDWAVLNERDERTPRIERETRARVCRFGVEGRRPFQLAVPGAHNQLNAQAAFAAASVLGVEWDDAQAAVRDFNGLPHRLELVHESGGVRYFNDSIATIPQAAVAALESFPPRTVIQIVGGDDKGLDMTPMFDALSRRAKAVLCVGKTGPAAAAAVRDRRGAPAEDCGDLAAAVARAKKIAAPGDVVLLSPGYASYDQFVNFEKRGEAFAALVRGGGGFRG